MAISKLGRDAAGPWRDAISGSWSGPKLTGGDERFFLVASNKGSAIGGGCWNNEIASLLPIYQVYENVGCFFL
jgi:hypothetical protein